VSNQDVAISLQTYLDGIDITDYREEDQLIPVTLRSVAAGRLAVDTLETPNVYSQATGASVPLSQVADAHVEWEPAKIRRRDRLRTPRPEHRPQRHPDHRLEPFLRQGRGHSRAQGSERAADRGAHRAGGRRVAEATA
jgi:hypothetical protein